MPLYDYDCAACGRRIEVIHGVHAPGPTQCPNCGGGPLKKAISAPAVHFKGSGWAKKERRVTVSAGSSQASDGASADGAGEGKTADGDAKHADAERKRPEGEGKGGGSSPGSIADKGGDGGSADGGSADQRPARSSKSTGIDAATKTN